MTNPTTTSPGGESSFHPGLVVGHFELIESIGAGGYGEVWKAHDLTLHRYVAIKRAVWAASRESELRFRREARAASSVIHPHIATIHEFAEWNGESLLVMEYVEGKTLRETLTERSFTPAEVIGIARQILAAVGYAHGRGLLHRDIKSGNIMLTPAGDVKVLDFGLAKSLGRETPIDATTEQQLTAKGAVVGTLHYMSPEQLRGESLDERSDLFSVGVVLYEMLAGHTPFAGNSTVALSDAILHSRPKPLPQSVPRPLRNVITRLLAKNREDRFATAADAQKALDVFSGPSAPIPARPGLAFGVGFIVLLLLIGAGTWLFQKRRHERWLRDTAIPQIETLVTNENSIEAMRLIQRARESDPDDRTLQKLWSRATMELPISSNPPGADVYVIRYGDHTGLWMYVGRTPMKKAVVPSGLLFLFKFTKPGHRTAFRIWPWLPRTEVSAVLDRDGTTPAEMIHIGAQHSRLVFNGLEGAPPLPVTDYLIDRYEVTNEEFKRFIAAGGYIRPEYWADDLEDNGHGIPWKDAMARFVDSTGRPGPATWELSMYPKGQGDFPVSGVSWFEAAAYARFAGKRLPTVYHWALAAETRTEPAFIAISNFSRKGPIAVHASRAINAFGTFDMAGNVKEWCSNEAKKGTRYILGGGWDEPEYSFHDVDAQSPWERRTSFGFRCMRPIGAISPGVESALWLTPRDFSKQRPVSDEIYAAYLGLYRYDHTKLEAVIDPATQSSDDWIRQRVTMNAAYGNEKLIAYLYLPKNSRPPYQTIVYYPGGGAVSAKDPSGSLPQYDFLPKSGRAVLIPVYKGTYDRHEPEMQISSAATADYRDHVIAWAKDLSRSLDYLETRNDIDHRSYGYYGYSWGGDMGLIMPAVEPRLKAVVLAVGSLDSDKPLPEVDQMNFASRIRVPVLMINGRYDAYSSVESNQRPMFNLLGSRLADKRWIVVDSGHGLPRQTLVKETVDWFDRYLGPVGR